MPNFKLELTKFWKSKKLVLLLLLCVLIPSAIFYWNYSNLDRYANELFGRMSIIQSNISATRTEYHATMREAGLSLSEITFHMTYHDKMRFEMRKFSRIPQTIASKYEIPEQMVAFYQAYQDYAEDRTINANGRQLFYLSDGDPERVEAEKAFFQELVDRGLPYEDPMYTVYGLNFTKSVIDVAFALILALFLLFLLTDIFSEEKTNGTEKIRLTQPVKRLNILLAKLAASLVYILLFMVLTAIISYLLAGLLGSGFGSIHYPVQSTPDLISTGISVGQYIALALLYFSLYLLVIFSCIALFSAVVKETAIVAVLVMFTAIIGGSINPSFLNPFSYLDSDYLILRAQSHPLIIVGIALATSSFLILATHFLSRTTWVQNFTLEPKAKDGGKALVKYEKKRSRSAPYFRFEILKIVKRKATVIPFILLLILVTVIGLHKYFQYEENRALEIELYQGSLEWAERDLARYEQCIAEDDSLTANFSGAITKMTNQYNICTRAIEALNAGDLTGIVESKKDYFLHDLSMLWSPYPDEARDVFLVELDEIVERQVQPELTRDLLYQALVKSPFVYSASTRNDRNINLQPSTTYIFNSLFKDSLGILALAVFAISLALGFSDETHDTRTIYLLNTQPLHRKRIYFGKLLAQSAVFISMALIMAAVLFLGLKLSGSPTEPNFPAVQYLNEIGDDYTNEELLRMNLTDNRGRELPESSSFLVGFTFRDMIYENAEMAAMFILSGLGMVAFAILASLKIRHKIGVSLGTVLVFGLGFLVSRYALKGTSIFFPFIWLDTPLVATGEASMIFDKTNMTGLCGILVLILWLIAFVVLGYKVFSKRGRYQ